MVKGVAGFRRRMRDVPVNIRAEIALQLEKEAAKVVAGMRATAPKLTGELAASIGWTWGAAPAGSITIGRVARSEFDQIAITIYAGNASTMVYNSRGIAFQKARLQEFGTVRMPANPFFFPIWRAEKRRVRGNLTRAIRRGAQRS